VPAPEPDPILITAGPVAVRFRWQGDRWGHEVLGPRATLLWRSVEGPGGRGDPRWPESPAWVSISRLGSGGAAPLLAVGQAGRTHYSAAIAPDPAHPEALRFDVAARIQEGPGWVGSTYAAGGTGGGGPLRITPLPLGGESLPRTLRWCYRLSATGLEALAGTSLVEATEA
jgi:hypothetical protein